MSKGGNLLENVGMLVAPRETQGIMNLPVTRAARSDALDQNSALKQLTAILGNGMSGRQPSQDLNVSGSGPPMMADLKLGQAMDGSGATAQSSLSNFLTRQGAPQLATRADPESALKAYQSTLIDAPRYDEVNPGASLTRTTRKGGTETLFTAPKNDEMTPFQKAQLERTDGRLAQQDRAINAQADRAAQADRRAEASEERRRHPQSTPYVNRTSGNPVRLDPTSGSYMDGENAISAADLIPAHDFNKNVDTARGLVGQIAQAEEIKKMIAANPGAFDKDKVNEARLKKTFIPGVGDQMATAVFTPEENAVRANVAQQSAAIINELYGAALSAGEEGRANTFAPGPNDTLEQLLPKLEASMNWSNTKRAGLIPGAVAAAERQLGRPSTPSTPAQAAAGAPAKLSADANGQAAYNAMPKGTQYIDPKGIMRIKG